MKSAVEFNSHIAYPVPFIVGLERSGTTLLRSMLNAHPDMALPYENHLWEDINALMRSPLLVPETFIASLESSVARIELGIDVELIQRKLSRGMELAEAMQFIYQSYAASQGKIRAGDKTPKNLHMMRSISQKFPAAHFIHIIRDGRAVAASVRELWFSPAKTAAGLAHHWNHCIQKGRQAGKQIPHYLEIHYEELVRDAESVLRRVCNFIELPFDSSMLNYHENAIEEIRSIGFWHGDTWTVSGKDIASIHSNIGKPPDQSRIDAWRSILSQTEQEEFNEIAGSLLLELGYEV
jgi:hypothetical protein